MIFAPKFPLKFKEKKGFEDVNDVKELVKFHLTNLLLTNPGEKISDPSYGVGIRQMLFENISLGVLNLWQDKITTGLDNYVTYIRVSDVAITPFAELNKINIKIQYNLLNDTENQILEIELVSGNDIAGPTY